MIESKKLNELGLKVIESNDTLKKLSEELEKKPELVEEFRNAKSQEEIYEVVHSVLPDLSFEDLNAAMLSAKDIITDADGNVMEELTDDQLEAVSGGGVGEAIGIVAGVIVIGVFIGWIL